MQARVVLIFKTMYIYTYKKKILYAKLIYYNYPNENFEHLSLRTTKFWVQQK